MNRFDCSMTLRYGACPLVKECVGQCGYKRAREILDAQPALATTPDELVKVGLYPAWKD